MREMNIHNYQMIRIHKDSRKVVCIYQSTKAKSHFKASITSKDGTKNSHFYFMLNIEDAGHDWTSQEDYKMPKWVITHVSKIYLSAKKALDTSLYGQLVEQAKEFNETNDCTVKSVAVAANISYADSHALLKRNGRTSRKGMYHHQYVSALKNDLGREVVEMRWTEITDLAKTIGCKTLTMNNVVKVLDKRKRYLVNMRGHVAGVANGVLEDWSNGRKFQVISIVEVKA